MGSGIDKRALPASVYDVLLESSTVAEARQRSEKGGYDVLAANRELAGAEVELVALEQRNLRLRQALKPVQADYDFVLIDCPPSLSLLTLNGLCSAHGVLVPMQCEYFALEGLSDLVNTIKQVHANLNRELQVIGLLRVMFDPRITLQQQVSDQLKAHFGDKVFDTMIPRNVRLAEAPSYGQAGVVFDPQSKGAQAYVAFARELALLSRIEDAGLNASAPPQQRWMDGWLVRFSPGKAKRARCINAVAEGRLPLADKLRLAQAVFDEAGLPMVIRITPFTQPATLDAELQAMGLASLDDIRRLRLSPVPFQAFGIVREDDDALLACGQFAREADLVGLYDVFTAPDHRGQGLAACLCFTPAGAGP
ncbi:hypothetical protein GTA08_BOTSDO14359 [Botryosphaeria dothidea]|uniref:AAA domain-containing protein n=1 Tax=Botryosphaeria dothidea TaxID=55169 RepID=A0A8H4J5M0_9PEZI|nr:hypothetical protein GTA08_BOTSDO14359 [Botryosphaeria dothidea]